MHMINQSHDATPTKDDCSPTAPIRLTFDILTGVLSAHIDPTHTSSTHANTDWSLGELKHYIQHEGYEAVEIHDDILIKLLKSIKNGKKQNMTLGTQTQFTDIEYQCDENSQTVLAILSQSKTIIKHSLASLIDKFESANNSSITIEKNTFKTLLKKINSNTQGVIDLKKLDKKITTYNYIDLSFEYEKDSRKLFANLKHSDVPVSYTLASLNQILKEYTFYYFIIPEHTLSDIINWTEEKKTGRFLIAEKPWRSKVMLEFDQESKQLNANIIESDEVVIINKFTLQALIRESGYDTFYFEDKAIENILTKTAAHEYGIYPLAEQKDAQATIEFDALKMKAYLTICASFGGKNLTLLDLNEEIEQHGIQSHYCNTQILEQAIKQQSVNKIEFSHGVSPINGQCSTFEKLTPEYVYIRPEINIPGEHKVDNIKEFIVVEAHTPLLRRIPATLGTNGYNVLGETVIATPGEEISFPKKLTNTQLDPNDNNVLIASCKGHPTFHRNDVHINESISFENVNNRTGDVDFDGSVFVRSDVSHGMSIKATGDIIVKGMVLDASLQAGNNVLVGNGIVGSEQKDRHGKHIYSATVYAKNTITSRYISFYTLQAENNIEVREYLSHCIAKAGSYILAGQHTGKGVIFGGNCHGNLGVEANILGRDTGEKTIISTGFSALQKQHYTDLMNQRDDLLKKTEHLVKILMQLKKTYENSTNKEMIRKKEIKIGHGIVESGHKVKKLNIQINRLKKALALDKDKHITFKKKASVNVTIHIGIEEFNVRQESKAGHFTLCGSSIRWQAL